MARKFYYVRMASLYYDEISNKTKDYITLRRWTIDKCNDELVSHIINVKRIIINKQDSILGKYTSEIRDTYMEPIPIICELTKDKDGNDVLVDLITDESFLCADNYTILDTIEPTERPMFSTVKEISAADVAKKLKDLDDFAIIDYTEGMQGLIKGVKQGYNDYIRNKKQAEAKRSYEETNVDMYRYRFAKIRSEMKNHDK